MSGIITLAKRVLNLLPDRGRYLKDTYWKARLLSKRALAKLMAMTKRRNIPDIEKIYWISPHRIVYHTNYCKSEDVPFRDRIFDPIKDKGKIVGGDWDISDFKFTDLDIYKAFEARMRSNVKWQDTGFYRRVLDNINSGNPRWNCRSKEDLDKRCEYLDRLIECIKEKGYKLSSEVQIEDEKGFMARQEEVTVNVGRNGEFLFENGRHRLAIAKILNVPKIPVKIVVRHRLWQEFRESLMLYAKISGGKLYQPLLHPDLSDIPSSHICQDRLDAIKNNIDIVPGAKVLDIGAYIGYFCHKLEDLGFDCYAVELSPELCYIARKIRRAENKKFKIIEKSIFQAPVVDSVKFHAVLALNIFHHFIKTEEQHEQLVNLLGRLKMNAMFFEPHKPDEPQMKDAFANYSEDEFVDFILRHSCLNNSKVIHIANDGRKMYKLTS